MARRKWTAEEEAMLGTMTDKQLARRLRRSLDGIKSHRWRLGTPGYRRARKWTKREDALLGPTPDEEAAKRVGCTPWQATKRRRQLRRLKPRPYRSQWTPIAEKLLGQVPDRVVAQVLGCTKDAVGKHRRKLGIAAWRSQQVQCVD